MLVELVAEHGHVAQHDVPGNTVEKVKEQGEDNAGDGRIKRDLDAVEHCLHTVEGGVDGAEADAADTDDQAHKGAQDTETCQRAGYLVYKILPASHGEDIVIDVIVHIAQDLGGLLLELDLLLVVIQKLVHGALMEKLLRLRNARPYGHGLRLENPVDVVASVLEGRGILQNRENAEDDADDHHDLHDDREHRGDVIRGVGGQKNAAYQQNQDQNIRQSSHFVSFFIVRYIFPKPQKVLSHNIAWKLLEFKFVL